MRTKKQLSVVWQDPEKWEGREDDFFLLSLEVKDKLYILQTDKNINVMDVEFKEVQGKMYGIIKWEILND